ncbi:MAG TPA: hypothetical protein VG322_14245 [Candidatus Acidoferrales bacterium]|nr:hypothetical protein [Candidatus Acidoferrales bacterium]
MEAIINAAIDMLNKQGHTVRAQNSKCTQFEINGLPVTRQEILELVNGTYSVEDLQQQVQQNRKQRSQTNGR